MKTLMRAISRVRFLATSSPVLLPAAAAAAFAVSLTVSLTVSSSAFAQTVGVTRTQVLQQDISIPQHDAVVSRVEVAPGGKLAWHTHPGDEIAYVESGELTVMAAGKPDRKVAAGGGFVVPAGTVHGVKNEGSTPVELITVHILQKGQPLATPAAAPAP